MRRSFCAIINISAQEDGIQGENCGQLGTCRGQ
jgi:hypothetical protein